LDSFFLPGDGVAWPCRAVGPSSVAKVSANEVEFVRKVLSSGQFAVLLGVSRLRHHVLDVDDEEFRGFERIGQ
jgi:hypothetical protein